MCTDEPSNLPTRGRPIHQPLVGDDNRSMIVFLTVCTEHRQRILNTRVMHNRLIAAWRASTHWLVGRYVVMPDHIHLFCAPNSYPARLHWRLGSRTGNDKPLSRMADASGRKISGMSNGGSTKATPPDGNIRATIRYGREWLRPRMNGHTKGS